MYCQYVFCLFKKNLCYNFFEVGTIMKIKASEYTPGEVLKFVRQATDLTQKEFAKTINKSEHWCQSNELGRSNYYFKDLLKLAKEHNFEIYIIKK